MATPRLVTAGGVATPEAVASVILVLGAPRSGTTWLAKIIDSHPNVLYRHEPDETCPESEIVTPDALPGLLGRWIAGRDARTVSKRPFFPKSWQPAGAQAVRTVLAGLVSAAVRLPWPLDRLGQVQIPDLMCRPAPRVAIKSVRWAKGAALLARSMPHSRTVFILRHPSGQVASLMRGNRQRHFDLRAEGTDMPFDEATTIQFAAAHSVDDTAFQALPDAAKYAWSWRAFNEPAYDALASLPNVHIVLYEGLCAKPEALSRQILAFADLPWHPQTADFVARSSVHQGPAGYYAIFNDAVSAASRWRTTMSPDDQRAVQSVMASSPLVRLWPDLA